MKLLLSALLFSGAALAQQTATFPPPKSLGDVTGYGGNIQRTMRLLATSTPERRNTVKVLFYGQSITEQAWWKTVADDLRARFPHANLIIENRAIGGHSSQLLVKTAEADLYPFYPDLLIFHVYGSHIDYENLIRSVRERTTAEILQQNDHVTKPDALTEETDASKLTPKEWDPFINHSFLPGISKKYGTELVDQRSIWKQYLRDYELQPSALLKDGVHLNARGEFLMAEAVKAHLQVRPGTTPTPADAWVKTYEIGKDAKWENGKLKLEFTGNRVDLIASSKTAKSIPIRIDGRKPSEFPELYTFTQTTRYPQTNWPCLLRVQSGKPLQPEEWTLALKNVTGEVKAIQFELTGSTTGADGAGEVGKKFVSNSGRIVIDPEDWNLDYCMKVHGQRLSDCFQIQGQVLPQLADEAAAPASTPGVENVVTVAQGLPNTRHVLELTGGPETPIRAVRVYAPPLGGK
jgi:hypothetical protein